MSSQPLFLDSPVEFEKTGGMKTRLSDDPDSWEQEILGEAYKQLPFLGTFDVHVVLDKLDEERGYGFGSIEVRPKSDLPAETKRRRLSMIHVPLVIKDHTLQPLDIFIRGKRYSRLSEPRVRAALFRPDTFDSHQERPAENTFGNELMPPYSSMTGVNVKIGSAEEMARVIPILPQLDGRVLASHSDRIKSAMEDPSLKVAFESADDGVQAALASAMRLYTSDSVKTAGWLHAHIKPDVVQMVRQPNGNVLVKWAAAEMFSPQQEEVPPEAAQQMAGGDQMTQQLQQQGQTLAAPQAQVDQLCEDDLEVKPVDQFGLWKVQDAMGNQLVGWVFPRIYTFAGQAQSIMLFSNGSQHAVQDMIAGKLVGKATDLPKGPPQGYGALFSDKGGTAKVFVPMHITGTFSGPGGEMNFVGKTDAGEQVTVQFSDNVKDLTQVDQGTVIVPSCYSWMPLKAETDLVSDPSLFTKTAARKYSGTVELVSDGDAYSYRGSAIGKIASAHTKFIDRNQAMFMGALMGMTPELAKEAVDRAGRGELVAVEGLKVLIPAQEKMAAARAKVKQAMAELEQPIRNYFLLKEASVLEDAMTADRILGLGFINAENISTFVDMLPGLEDTQAKLAELLLAVRLGVKEIPEVAVERMLAALDDVISGLRTLHQKEVKFGE
jgi:hypothetical protein